MYTMLDETKKIIKKLLENQKFAVLATQSESEPYTNLIAFTSSCDHKNIIFATLKNTKKYSNIRKNSRISILVDNRNNESEDIKRATVISAFGYAQEIKNEIKSNKDLYLKKHPYLHNFINSKDCVLFNLKVDNYIVVNSFENIINLNPDDF